MLFRSLEHHAGTADQREREQVPEPDGIEREQQGSFLRVAISGGGCNGLSYKLKFSPAPKRGDIVVATAGVEVLVDSKSALYLKGTQLDFSSAMIAGGFKFSNPNAKASCSCGESFAV